MPGSAQIDEGAAKNKIIEFSPEAVSSTMLENGLVVLTKESPPEELVSIHIKVMAGSSLEGQYLGSGISHLVEHMLFKGTGSRKPGEIEREIKSYGGFINGFVSQDLADYNVTVQAKYLRQALLVLKDMLQNASFNEEELAKEKEVIASEMRLDLDEPTNQLVRLLYETAYMRHPYKYPPIGYEDLFKKITRSDAIAFYAKMYVPNNMVIAIVGGIRQADAEATVREVFSGFRAPNYDAVGPDIVEPPQIGKRGREKEKEINLAYLAAGFHSTRLLDRELFATDVLAMILGRGDNSRLNAGLVKKARLAYSISCSNYTPRDPGLFVITAVLDRQKIGELTDGIMREIMSIRQGRLDDAELDTAKRMVVADYIFSKQSIDGQSNGLSSDYILTGSYDFASRYVEGVQHVTKEDVVNAADTYLREDNLTLVKIVPEGYKGDAGVSQNKPAISNMTEEATLPNGLRILVRKDNKIPTISVTVAISGGTASETAENNGISNLAARMLLKGTDSKKEDEIRGAIEKLGGTISTYSSFDSFGVNVEVLNQDFDAAIAILKDILMNSTFPDGELEKEKSIVVSMIKEDDDDIFNKGFNALRKELFTGSPYALRTLGEESIVRRLTAAEIADYYRRRFSAPDTVISVSGDVDSDTACKKLKEVFSGIASLKSNFKAVSVPRMERTRSADVYMPKEQSLVLLGFQTMAAENKDRYAMDVICSVLSGTSGRLFDMIRDKAPLAYALGCFQRLARYTGFTAIYVATSKDNIAEVKKQVMAEVNKLTSSYISDDELEMAKREIKTQFDVAMQSNLFFSQKSALDELYGLGSNDLFAYKARIDSVTKEDVKRVAAAYLGTGIYAEIVVTQKQ